MIIDWGKFTNLVPVGCQCRYLSDSGRIKYGILQENWPCVGLDSAAQSAADLELLTWTRAGAQPEGKSLSIQLFEARWESGEYIMDMPVNLIEYLIDGQWKTFTEVMK